MLHRGMSKSQVEEELREKGDFVKIEHLTKFLREELSIDMKKFIYLKLARIYKRLKMFDNAAKMFGNASIVSVAYTEKINCHLNEAELYIESGDFEKVDEAIKKGMDNANANQRAEIIFQIKRFYLDKAKNYEREVKRNNAAKIYKKVLKMKLSYSEEKEIREKLIYLYKKLGKFKEIEMLKKEL